MIDEPRPNHACERIKQRYGVELTGGDLSAMCSLINRGKATIERDNRDGTQRVVVIYGGKAYFCIFSPRSNRIVTVLPHGWGGRAKEPSKKEFHRRVRRSA